MHLKVDEIIDFISFEKLDEHNIQIAKRVNGHILTCDECRSKVTDFQAVYDELIRRNTDCDFVKTFIKEQTLRTKDSGMYM